MRSFFILFLVCISVQAYCQESSNKFSLELLQYQNIDNTLTPLVNSGPAVRVEYTWEKQKANDLKTLKVGLLFANPKSDIELSRKSVVGGLLATFDHQIRLSNSDLFVGYSALLSYKDGFYKTIDQSHLYWSNFLGGGFSASYNKQLNQLSKLSIRFRLPLLGVVSRSKKDRLYKVENPSFSNIIKLNNTDPRLETAVHYINPTTEIEYTRVVSKKVALGVFFRNEYLSTESQGSLRYKELQNGLGIRFTAINK